MEKSNGGANAASKTHLRIETIKQKTAFEKYLVQTETLQQATQFNPY